MLTRDWDKDFYNLSQLLGGYFHQDFIIVHGSPEGALNAAIHHHSEMETRDVLRELDAFLACDISEKDRWNILLYDFGFSYEVAADGFTTRTWLLHVKERFERALAEHS